MELQKRQIPSEAEELIRRFVETAPPEEAARLLANTINRAVASLHRLSRDQATARKGTSEWATWAKLSNASRNAVLAASMCREIANGMASAPLPEGSDSRPKEQE